MAADPPPRYRFLPRTGSRPLLAAVLAFAALCAALVASFVADFASRGEIFKLVLAVACAAVGIGVWRLNPVARSAAQVMLAVSGLVLVLGLSSPFMASDVAAATGQAPNPWLVAAWVVPIGAVVVALLWIFEKHKPEFRRR